MARSGIIKSILERDGYRCGIHAFGCGNVIDVVKEPHDRDHIFPHVFFEELPKREKSQFLKKWNFQPMHRSCHNKRGKSQIVNCIPFKCGCHYSHISADGDRFVYYKDPLDRRNVWREVCYLDGALHPESFVIKPRKSPVQPGKDTTQIGFSSESGLEYGHAFTPFFPFARLLFNSQELFRCERYDKVLEELASFDGLRVLDGSYSFLKEFGNDYMAYLVDYYKMRYFANQLLTEGGGGYNYIARFVAKDVVRSESRFHYLASSVWATNGVKFTVRHDYAYIVAQMVVNDILSDIQWWAAKGKVALDMGDFH